jgi:glycosyltransferase involved in cell wall biosynthesis
MKIVHLTASRFVGGPERQMLGLAGALPDGFSTAFAAFSEGGRCGDFLRAAQAAGFPAVALRHDTPRLLAARNELIDVLRRQQADVLVPHGYKSNLIGVFAARRLRIPIVSVCHGWTSQCLRVRLYETLDRRILRWMDKVVCVSEAQAAKVRRAGVPAEKCLAIRDAVHAERFDVPDPAYAEALRRMFPDRPSLVVGAAGRLSPEKGFDLLVDAAAGVVRGEPRAGFVLFGDGPLRDVLCRRVVARGLQSRFILAGFRADIDKFFPHLDLFVQSSHTEGLPNVVLEALAAGVPVVATAVGGTAEAIDDGVDGCLVPPADATALAGRIAEMLCDTVRRKEMGARGQHRVRRKFSFARQAREYVPLLESLVPGRATSVGRETCLAEAASGR